MSSRAHYTACKDEDISPVQLLIILARILSYTAKQNKLFLSYTFITQLEISF